MLVFISGAQRSFKLAWKQPSEVDVNLNKVFEKQFEMVWKANRTVSVILKF